MKRLILASIETEGHSGTSCFIETNNQTYNDIIHDLIFYEEEQIYHFVRENKIDDNTIEQYYDGDLGEMVILVRSFGSYKEVENKEFYTRTG